MENYFKKLINSESKESSKRFLAFWFAGVLTFLLIWAGIKCENIEYPIWITVCLIAALMGMSTYLSAKQLKHTNKKEKPDESEGE